MNPTVDQWMQVAGWTLVHFSWQGGLVAIATAVALRVLRHASSQARYGVACAAMATMLAAPVVTAGVLSASAQSAPVDIHYFAFSSNGVTVVPWSHDALTLPPDGRRDARVWLEISRWLPFIVTTWLAGVALLLVRLGGGWWRVRRLHRASLAAAASCWQAVGDRIASRLRLGRAVHIVDSLLVNTPTVVGWVRPVIILPIAAFANLTPAQVEAILAHELAHIRRHDYLVNLLQTMTETLLFYHPAVWWVSGRIRAEREHCCDAVAVHVCGDAVGYATALAELETARTGRPAPMGQAALALAATGGSLLDRVRRVLSVPVEDVRPARSETMPAMMTAALVLLFVVGAAGVRRQPALLASSADGPEVDRSLSLLAPHLKPSPLFPSRTPQVRETVIVRVHRQGAPGQSSSTIVSGTISDVTGAAVLGATVVLSDVVTAVDHTAQTNQLGRFEFVGLAPGNYLFGVTASGLEPLHDRLTIFARETMPRDVTLPPQTLSFDITVLGGPLPDRGGNGFMVPRNNLRPLPRGWICSNTALTGTITSREYCGPASEVHELERDTQERLKVSGDKGAQPASMASTRALAYPQDLRDAMIEGSAVLEGRVGTDGSPIGLKSVAPVHPGLAKAALEAVGQWRFEPARLHDVAVESPLKVTINFRLHQ